MTMAKNGTRVQILNEIDPGPPNEWRVCFHRVRYIFADGDLAEGYRFMWRLPNGNLQAARGQARIPSLRMARYLMTQAEKEGWGHFDADNDQDIFQSAA
jgi:hypothetical protein